MQKREKAAACAGTLAELVCLRLLPGLPIAVMAVIVAPMTVIVAMVVIIMSAMYTPMNSAVMAIGVGHRFVHG